MADALSYFLSRAKKMMRKSVDRSTPKICLDVLTLESRDVPAGTYTGTVFEDYNGNGVRDLTNTVANSNNVGVTNLAIDRGLGGIVVTAYDSTGASKGSTTTANNGSYTLNYTGTGATRIEFSTASFPAGFTVGPIGPDNGSNVQFLADGGAANVNMGMLTPTDYLPNNPTIIAGIQSFGDPSKSFTNPNTNVYTPTPAIVTFPYSANDNGGTSVPQPTTLVTVDKVGSIYGLAQNPATGTIYVSSYTKKHSGWGPGGVGQIYSVNQTTGAVTNFVNLETIFPGSVSGSAAALVAARTAGGAGYDYDVDSGNVGWDAVGKSGYGGSALSPDGSTLYVISLGDRKLYAIPTSGPLNSTTITSQLIPLNAPGATGANAGDDLRPFAVTFYRGQLYVGIVNTAESTQQATDLHSYVYRVDPATLTFGAAPVFTVADMTFIRGQAATFGGSGNPPGDWLPWSPTFDHVGNTGSLPQPMLSSVTFDANGNMTLSFRDRGGDQFGFFTLDDPSSNTQRFEGVAAGDNLFAEIVTPNNLNSGWNLENNGATANFTGASPGNTQGPGGGEFYFDTYANFHQEIATGASIQLPGYPDVLSAAYDTANTVRAGGVMWLGVNGPAAQVGNKLKGYDLYQSGFPGNLPQNTATFGKSNGLAGLTVLAQPAPQEIGNYVWRDANGNGIQDATEQPVVGLAVELWDLGADGVAGGAGANADAVLGTATTNASGQYYFSGFNNITGQSYYVGGLNLLPNRGYQIRIPNATTLAGGAQQAAVTGLRPTTAFSDGTTDGTIRDSNGLVAADGTTGLINVTTGVAGTINHNFDVGFAVLLPFLGNHVWEDVNNNGQFDAGTDVQMQGVTVRLYDSTGTTLLNSTTTDAQGQYLFAGLNPGTFIVEVVTPAGYTSSTGNGSTRTLAAPGTYEPGTALDTNNDFDHGTNTSGVGSNIRTTTVQVFPVGNAGNPDPDTTGTANSGNLRQDFGLVRTYSLGNRVWLDVDNNGLLDAGETGISGVTVRLLSSTGTAILDAGGAAVTAVTDANGYYRFDNLAAGSYRVEVANSGPIATLRSSTGAVGVAGVTGPFEGAATPSPDTNVDSDDNGTFDSTSGTYRSGVVTLGPTATEPTSEADLGPGGQGAVDNQSNLTVDFGFFRPMSLGNRVWIDSNNNGKFDTGEPAASGVVVDLVDNTSAAVLDASNNPIKATTTAQGYYLFTGLNPGKYKVAIDKSNFTTGGVLVGYTSSTGGGNGSVTGPNEPIATLAGDNNDSGSVNGTLVTGGVITATVMLVNGTATVNESGGNTTPGIADTTADNDSELAVDFGFVPVLSLGNLVWNDLNNNGKLDVTEAGISGLTVRLLDSAGNPVLNGSNVAITTTTNANGYYLFSNLVPASYIVEVVPPAGFVSSTGTTGATSGPFEPGTAVGGTSDNMDHGTSVGSFFAPTSIRSGIINLQAGTATTGESATNGIADPALDANSETTVDFGLFRPLSIGNRIWKDANNNGMFDTGELPAVGVTVQLLDGAGNPLLSGGNPITTITDANGYYLFTGLGEGNYKIAVTAANFNTGGPLAGFKSSTGAANAFEPVTGLPGNNKDNGTTSGTLGSGGFVISNVIALTVGNAPTSEEGANGNTPGITDPARDQDSNVTIDFGFFQAMSLGNRLWIDANNNGMFDAGEAAVAGALVNLLDAAGNPVLSGGNPVTATTNSQGYYLFTGLNPAQYRVGIDKSNFATGGVLSGTTSSTGTGNAFGSTGPNEPAATLQGDDKDSGSVNGTLATGGVISAVITLVNGTATTGEPATPGFTDPTADANSELAVDFGFVPLLSLGNFVWNDLNNNGKVDTGEAGIAGLTVRLLDSTGNPVLNGSNNPIVTTTNAQGYYLFTNLLAGSYIVAIDPPAGFVSSTGTTGSTTGAFEPGTAVGGTSDNMDHGTSVGSFFAPTSIRSGIINLQPGTATTGESTTVNIADPALDASSETTVDFGLFRPLSIGNRVWFDANNNGVFDRGEQPGVGVTVQLLDGAGNPLLSGGNPITRTTNDQGYYLFTGLGEGTYKIAVTAANFNTGGPLAGYMSSTGVANAFEPVTGLPGNNQDNGTASGALGSGGFVISNAIALTVGNAPTSEEGANGNTPGITDPARDQDSNVTIDFGFFQAMSLGNRLWLDANNNGMFDAGEAAVAGALVNLLDAAGNPILSGGNPVTATTNSQGYYLFIGLNPAQYRVGIDKSNFATGGVLEGTTSSTGSGNAFGSTGPNEPAATLQGDDKDSGSINGTLATGGVISPIITLVSGTATTGEPATPGITDATADANSELTVDFGFVPLLSLGNFVWNDLNNNGKVDVNEAGIAGLTVRLLDSAGNPVLNGSNAPIVTTTNGQGYYLFTNLLAGNYIVAIDPPAGFVSSTGVSGSTTGAFEPGVGVGGTSDNMDHGTSVGSFFAPTSIQSGVINLQPGTATTRESVTVNIADPAIDSNSETTVDFGLFQPLSLGNRIWNDANNNGMFDTGETPLVGVTVQLLDGAGNPILNNGNPITTTTNAQGYYLFTALGEGTYEIAVTAGNFATGGPLEGYLSSIGTGNAFEPVTGLPGNNKDNGTTSGTLGAGGFVVSNAVTLTVGNAPTNEEGANGNTPGITDPARDQDSNVTIDFGFFLPLSLGNFVWNDINNNGLFDTAEAGIANVTVNLYQDNNNDGTPDGAALGTTATNAQGYYLFTGLAQGGYIVEVNGSTLPAGYWLSSTGKNGSPTGPNEGVATPDPNAVNTNNVDSGNTIVQNGNQFIVRAKTVQLAAGTAPTNDGTTPGITDPTPNANSNLTVDFGFFRPVALGNFVWNDKNNSGTVDAGEPGLAGVTVNLYDSTNTLVATTTTDVAGKYLFEGLTEGTYIVEILPLPGFISSTGNNGNATGPFEPAPTPRNNIDNTDNGTTLGAVIRSGSVTLTVDTQPTGEVGGLPTNTPDNSSNQTVDFGLFVPLTLGNLVWNDINNNGTADAGEPGLAGVVVTLYADANSDGIPDGTALATTTTNASGSYLFTNLGEGKYLVGVAAPANYISSSGTNGSASGPFEPAAKLATGIDSSDAGTTSGNIILSGTVMLMVGGAPTGEPTTPGITDTTPDANANYTVDFGLYRPLSVGDLVWNDLNNNGTVDAGEAGVPNVVVTLTTTGGTVIGTTTTASDGSYHFTNLSPGDYVVQITPPAGFISSTGGTNGSGPYEPASSPNNDVNNDDNGTLSGGVIRSLPITLSVGGEPANGGDDNPTVDFGIFQPMSIGNLVFNDVNNNGKVDAGEAGIAGVVVRVYRDDNKDGIPDGAALGSTTTNAAGSYLFTGLGQGGYVIEVDGSTVPTGFISSSGLNGSATGPFEPAPTPTTTIDGTDHGTKLGTVYRSGPIMLMLGGAPTGEPATPGIADSTPDANSNATVDFGFLQPISFGNTVWRDDNNNGKLDPGEPVLPGIPVKLLDSNGNVVGSTTTNANGTYQFTNLSPGTYTVQITPPAGVLPSTPVFNPLTGGDNQNIGTLVNGVITSQPITLALGQAPLVGGNTNSNNYVTGDFGLLSLAMVSGYVYRDPDLSGTFTPGVNDTPIGGVTVVLTGTTVGGQTVTPLTATTDSTGFYKFANLTPGTYNINELPPNGYLLKGADNVGSLGGSNPLSANLAVTLNANDNGVLYNFGHYTPAALYGNVFVDSNGNCVMDPGEPGIPGVPMVISGTAFSGLTTARPLTAADVPGGLTVFTNAQGRYVFPALPPGTYTVSEAVQPSAYLDGCEQNGDPNGPAPAMSNDVFSGISLNPAQNRGPFNFGEIVADPTKREFLSSTIGIGGFPVSTNSPVASAPLNPTFTTTTGTPSKSAFVVTAAGAGTSPLVRVFDYATGGQVMQFLAYENAFTGGVRATTGDVNGDGTPDIITGIGVGGGPRVRVFSGKNGGVLQDFFAYEPTFTGGLFVASADINGDGKADIITGVEVGGGPRVQVFDGVTLQPIMNFFAFDPSQRGGVRVASGDFNADGRADIVTTTGVGVATMVRVFDAKTGSMIKEFAPYTNSFTGGVSLAVGDVNGDGAADIVTGAEAGGGPHVQVFDGKTNTVIASFFAYEPTFTGGVRVATQDVNGDGKADIVTAPASKAPSRVRIINAITLNDFDTFFAFDPQFLGGTYVG